jgi:hypothetical protein
MRAPFSFVSILSVSLAAPSVAHAWDSRCYEYQDVTRDPSALRPTAPPACAPEAGPHVVRARWIGPLDEHRAIFERTRRLAGLPESISSTVRLQVFTDGHVVNDGHAQIATLTPTAFESARATANRYFTVGELAQLPDFSYALWDWATGNEECPLPDVGTDAVDCHAFGTHMGPVNANHFVPQSREFYAAGHRAAMTRAAACREMATRLGEDARGNGPYARYALACEIEALAIEAVAQHYLQDAWSTGHMWQRWGAPELGDLPGRNTDERRARALLVALTAGLVHGARGVLQAVPSSVAYDVNDALSAPLAGVRFVLDGHLVQGLGDDYLDTMVPPRSDTPNPLYRAQYERMMQCTSAGLLEVYRESGMQHGALRADAALHGGIDPTSDACWSQRVTNLAMQAALGIQYRVLGVQNETELDARLVSWMLPNLGVTSGHAAMNDLLRNQFRFDLTRVVSRVRLIARTTPDATQLADGAFGDFMGVHPNGAYLEQARHTTYADPPAPWGAAMTASDGRIRDRATAIVRTFHEAHADDLCAATSQATLDALRAHASDASLPASAHTAACAACITIAERHVTVATQPSLCARLAPSASAITAPPDATDPLTAARAWCGCR